MKTEYELCVNCKDKNVLLIVDYNVKIDNTTHLRNTYKIDKTFPTIDAIISQIPLSLTITTHLGRPTNRSMNSTVPIFDYLKITKLPELEFKEIYEFPKLLKGVYPVSEEEATLFYFTDNIRYYSEDEIHEFIQSFDVIISDAFGSLHRKSSYSAYPGLLMQQELDVFNNLPMFDFVIMGGAKISDKLKYISHIESDIFLGGGLANSIFKALGFEMGDKSISEPMKLDNLNKSIKLGDKIVYESTASSKSIILPIDFLVLNSSNEYKVKSFENIKKSDIIVDIGEKSIEKIKEIVDQHSFVFWNSPLGKYEDEKATATRELIKFLEKSKAKIIIGGGESLDAVNKYSSPSHFFHVSTGGGSGLQLISKMPMPGLESLKF